VPLEALAEAGSGPAAIAVVIVGVGVEDEDHVEVVTNPRRRNGSQSQNWAGWSKLGKLQAWSKSIYTLCQSRSTRLWIGFCQS